MPVFRSVWDGLPAEIELEDHYEGGTSLLEMVDQARQKTAMFVRHNTAKCPKVNVTRRAYGAQS